MTFEELQSLDADLDLGVRHLLVFHSDSSYIQHFKSGMVLERVDAFTFVDIEGKCKHTKIMRGDKRRVITTYMKERPRRYMMKSFSVNVKCLYPLKTGSHYYTDEELFMAEMSGDYSEIYKRIKKDFTAWKKSN
jgi:hypothetical protein